VAKSGLKHIDVGPQASKAEWESEESHELVHGNSFPDSPVERQLFYRDDEHKWYIYNGTGWVDLQGAGGGGGMEVHGNEYHDPNFEEEGVAASLVETHRTTATHTQPQPPATHKTSHQDGGSDEVSVAGLSGLLADGQTPLAHKTSHQDGGADEMSVAGLNGELAGLQKVKDHTHQSAGSGVGGKLDHGLALNGLSDDDHPQYIKHSLATAVSNFLVASGAGVFVKKTLAEVKTLLNWAADIATHAAVADAHHAEDHASRHQFLGDDLLDIGKLIVLGAWSYTDWQTRDNWTDYLVGSGGVTWLGILAMRPNTGATLNSIGSLYCGSSVSMSPVSNGRLVACNIALRSAVTDSEVWAVARRSDEDPDSFPSLIERHVGFRVLNGRLYASNGNGTNGTQTDTGIDFAQYGAKILVALGGSGEIKFYCNSVLVATHTTNLPATYGYRAWYGIENTIAADKVLEVKWSAFTG